MNNVYIERAVLVVGKEITDKAKSFGAALGRASNARGALADQLYKEQREPAFLANKEVQDVLTPVFAIGLGTIKDKDVKKHFKTHAELVECSSDKLTRLIEDAVEAAKHASGAAKKRLSGKASELRKCSKHRNATLSRISPNFRDLAAMLITRYKKDAKRDALTTNKDVEGYTSKDANREADKLAYDMKTSLAKEGGFRIKLTDGEKLAAGIEDNKPDETETLAKETANYLAKLQELENPPKNFRKLVAELTTLLDSLPKH